MMKTCHAIFICILLWTIRSARGAEEVIFPADAGALNLRDFGAVGDGKTDDTVALNAALTALKSGKTLYLPNGTYLVSDTLNANNVFTSIQGQSRDGVILRLQNHAPGFDDAAKPKPVFKTKEGNDAFVQRFANFTVDVGTGNPGAIGMIYISCNHGSLEDVRIHTSDPDGAGARGLDLSGSNPGLSIVKNVDISGFDCGIYYGGMLPGMAFEHVTLTGQKKIAFLARGNNAALRDVNTNGDVPALKVETGANLVVTDCTFQSPGTNAPAIENEGRLLARNIQTRGYTQALVDHGSPFKGNTVDEYNSESAQSLFPSTGRTLNLKVEEAPVIPWNADGGIEKWVNVVKYGAKANDQGDDTDAIQAAINDAKQKGLTTVYFPCGKYIVSRTLELSGSVRRLIGFPSTLESSDGSQVWPYNPFFKDKSLPVMISIGPGADVVEIDRLTCRGVVDHAAANTAIFKWCAGIDYRNSVTGGKAFFEDSGGLYDIKGPQSVWVRLWDPTWGLGKYPHFRVDKDNPAYARNDGGTLWIMGIDHESTEQTHVMIRNLNGAQTEVLKILSWRTFEQAKLFDNQNSRLSIAGLMAETPNYGVDTHDGWTRAGPFKQGTLYVSDTPATCAAVETVRGLKANPTGHVWPFDIALEWAPISLKPEAFRGYEVLRDGKHVAFTQRPLYTDQPMQASTPFEYSVRAIDAKGTESLPSIASTTTVADTVPLTLQSANAISSPAEIHLVFSKPLSTQNALQLANYKIEGAEIKSVSIESDQRTVTLHTATLEAGKTYNVTFAQIQDLATPAQNLKNISSRVEPMQVGDGVSVTYASAGTPDSIVSREVAANVQVNWHDIAPRPGMSSENYQVTWNARLSPRRSGLVQFIVESADAITLSIDGKTIIDSTKTAADMHDSSAPSANDQLSSPVALTAGRVLRIEIKDGPTDRQRAGGLILARDQRYE